MQSVIWGLGLTSVFAFVRYRWPAMHPTLASIGIAAGVWLMAFAYFEKNPFLWPIMMMFAGGLLILVGIDWYSTMKKERAKTQAPIAAIERPVEQAMTEDKKGWPPVNITGSGNITTFGQIGGTNIINNGPRYGVVGPDTIASIKREIPAGSNVTVGRVGGAEATYDRAATLHALLKAEGYAVGDMPSDLLGGPEVKGLQLQKNGENDYLILVGDMRLD